MCGIFSIQWKQNDEPCSSIDDMNSIWLDIYFIWNWKKEEMLTFEYPYIEMTHFQRSQLLRTIQTFDLFDGLTGYTTSSSP